MIYIYTIYIYDIYLYILYIYIIYIFYKFMISICLEEFMQPLPISLPTTATLMVTSSGKELRKMLKENGDFQSMEVQVKKKHTRTDKETKGGGWFTKGYLERHAFWTKTLI